MAPEQIRGKPRPASDICLAIVVYEWLCGTRPFQWTSQWEILSASLPPTSEPSRKTALDPSRGESSCLERLNKDPQQRFTDVKALPNALERRISPRIDINH